MNMKSFLDKRELISFCIAVDEKIDPSEFTTESCSSLDKDPKDVFSPWYSIKSKILPDGKRHGAYFEAWSDTLGQVGTIKSQFHFGLLQDEFYLNFWDICAKQHTIILAEFCKGIPLPKVEIFCVSGREEIWSCSWIYGSGAIPTCVEGTQRIVTDIKFSEKCP
ncbi:hypothetical protein GMAR_ORF79 [Golden Marseillevirus]|uniref:hypothetical protein n=1 Tax=Golden Marseillevirus TaxID=1720526 RepID=UPI000877ACC1|nr:hypothetical protein GMAR_ORF79 [Golden Marseillevirus]ALX27454.1 hypothetical protein GMAR_ORF79 [Golden Marseillevirus]